MSFDLIAQGLQGLSRTGLTLKQHRKSYTLTINHTDNMYFSIIIHL